MAAQFQSGQNQGSRFWLQTLRASCPAFTFNGKEVERVHHSSTLGLSFTQPKS